MNLGNQMSCLAGNPTFEEFAYPSVPPDNTGVYFPPITPEPGEIIINDPTGLPIVGSSTNTETLTSKPKRHILPTLAGVVGAYVLYKQFT